MLETQSYIRTPGEYLAIFKRRRYWLIMPAALVLIVAIILAFKMPATYESHSVILVEEQQVPSDFMRATITSYADQQVQVITQRVLTADNIAEIVREFHVYDEEGQSQDELGMRFVTRFRENVDVSLVSADVIDPRNGRPTEATIAFTVGFTHSNPEIAQAVATELTRLFVNENEQGRARQVESTEEFFIEEVARISAELTDIETQITQFKVENAGSLPEQFNFNLDVLEREQRALASLETRKQELEKRGVELAAKMSQMSPSAPVVLATGDVVLGDMDRLRALQTEYRRKSAIYRDNHPDVVRLEREIESLQQELGTGEDVETLQRQLNEQQQRLVSLQARYNNDHQEVISTQRIVEQLQASIQNSSRSPSPSANGLGVTADNPAYVLLQTEQYNVQSELRSISDREQRMLTRVQDYQQLVQQAPEVERAYAVLQREHENILEEYERAKSNQRDARAARQLETDRKGDRFMLIEPPLLPLEPISPNRPLIIILGIILAAGFGVATVLVRELTDRSVRGTNELTYLLGAAPLVSIPYIENREDRLASRRTFVTACASLAGFAVVIYLLQPLLY